ncbi:unnamed protein product [Owenia fusiformis]|uniref:Uncharacterized protein n=1 Tax=Owenia fusiformis TaxID=6347 RepID=A0A8S4PTT8_OWEFU|nr:unnamed protein product [Owenia fusiformis]
MEILKCILLSIWICTVLISNIMMESCSKRGPQNRTPTNFTVYKRTLTIIADGVRVSLKKAPWPDTWENFWNDAGSSTVKFGRKFIKWADEEYGFNATALTDEQLTNGDEVDLGEFIYTPYMPDITYRVISETTKTKMTYYRNTQVRDAAFVLIAKKSFNSSGNLRETIQEGAILFMGVYIIDTSKECGLSKKPEVISFTCNMDPRTDNGFGPFVCDMFSRKYGVGEQIGLSVVTSPNYFKVASVMFFPPAASITGLDKP